MLYYFFRFLEQFDIPGSHMWSYISFRALLTLILALLISAWFGERFIKWMKRRKIFETERDPSIDPFGVEKKGVPTMGGIIIIVSILVPVLLLCRIRNIYIILMVVTTLWLGFLGFLDDYIKIFRRNKEGLKGKYKIVGQVSIGFIVGLTLWLSPDAVVRETLSEPQITMTKTVHTETIETVVKHKKEAVKSLQTTIPFVKNHNLNYSNVMGFLGDNKVAAGWVLFVLMTIFVVTGVSNGANLNDGMDGMCPRSWWCSSVPSSVRWSASCGITLTQPRYLWVIRVRSPSAASSVSVPSSSTRSCCCPSSAASSSWRA